MSEFWKSLMTIAGSSGISIIAVLIFVSRNWFLERLKGSIKHEYAKGLENHKNNLRKKTDTELARLSGNVSVEVEKAKLKMSFYSEKQFDLYNDLWLSLCELKKTMNELWDHVDEKNLSKFSKQLLLTNDLLEKRAILIEPEDYQELERILREFMHFQVGKMTLVELKLEQEKIKDFDIEEIRRQINENRQQRQELLDCVSQMRDCLRRQICGQAGQA